MKLPRFAWQSKWLSACLRAFEPCCAGPRRMGNRLRDRSTQPATGCQRHKLQADCRRRSALGVAACGTGKPTIASSPFVLIDWGATVTGYRSDLTRVLVTGKLPPKFGKMYETVLAAQQAAIEAMRPGIMVSQVDSIARAVIEKQGMGKNFNHGLGHGIGLDIHEAPRLGKNQDRPLEAGMVVTVEPGVYFSGFGGVRIEDDILITRDGHEVLSSLPRSLEENRVELLG